MSTMVTMKRGIHIVLCGLLLAQNVILSQALEEKHYNGKRQLGLEDYMRYTPRPTPGPEATGSTAPAPTIQPTTLAPSRAPSSIPSLSPSNSPTTTAPSEAPTLAATTAAPTSAPTEAPTLAATTAAPTSAPTEAPTRPAEEEETTTEETTTAEETKTPITEEETEAPTEPAGKEIVEQPLDEEEEEEEEEARGLYSETKEYQDSLGSVSVDFSLFSPNVTVVEMNFVKLREGFMESIDSILCEPGHPATEEGPEYCSVREDVLLVDGESRQLQLAGDYNTTIIALSATNVKDVSGGAPPIEWTTWRMSWQVLQFGPSLLESIEEMHGTGLDEVEVRTMGIEMLQEIMTVNMEETLESGDLQQEINDFMKDITLVTSFVGEEVSTYKIYVPRDPSSPTGSELEDDGGEGGGLMVILFFAGLGVACLVIVGLLYFSFRSRRSRIRRKRTIVILDDTAKDSEEVEKDKFHGSGTEPGTPSTPTAPFIEPKEAAKSQEKVILETDKVILETDNVLRKDPPQADGADQAQQRWEGASVDGEEHSISPEDGDGDGDVESQWGRSAAQSSAYTGSISAITGVSGLEQSDTWSVGSMSIDLAEWG